LSAHPDTRSHPHGRTVDFSELITGIKSDDSKALAEEETALAKSEATAEGAKNLGIGGGLAGAAACPACSCRPSHGDCSAVCGRVARGRSAGRGG
jgi:hypothetical protein